MITIKIPYKIANLILAIIGLCVALFMLEIGARVWLNYLATPDDYLNYALYTEIPPEAFLWTSHHYLNYYPSPNYHKGLLAHNALSYRGDEFSLKKPPSVYRVVVLGGSAVYTEKVKDNAKTFPQQLENVLRADYGYQQVQVINAGVPGYNTWESLINLEFRVLDLEPDLVIIYHNTNDVHARLVEPYAYRGDNSGERKQWHEPPLAWWEYSTILRIVGRKRDWGNQARLRDFVDAPTLLEYTQGDRIAALAQNRPIYFERNLKNIIAIARANQVEIMLATWAYSPYFDDYAATDYYQQAYQEQNEVIINLARDQNVPVFDFAAQMPQSEELWADGRHVNEAGALRKAQLFAQFIDTADLIPEQRNLSP